MAARLTRLCSIYKTILIDHHVLWLNNILIFLNLIQVQGQTPKVWGLWFCHIKSFFCWLVFCYLTVFREILPTATLGTLNLKFTDNLHRKIVHTAIMNIPLTPTLVSRPAKRICTPSIPSWGCANHFSLAFKLILATYNLNTTFSATVFIVLA